MLSSAELRSSATYAISPVPSSHGHHLTPEASLGKVPAAILIPPVAFSLMWKCGEWFDFSPLGVRRKSLPVSRASLPPRNGQNSPSARRTRPTATSSYWSSGASWSRMPPGAGARATRSPNREAEPDRAGRTGSTGRQKLSTRSSASSAWASPASVNLKPLRSKESTGRVGLGGRPPRPTRPLHPLHRTGATPYDWAEISSSAGVVEGDQHAPSSSCSRMGGRPAHGRDPSTRRPGRRCPRSRDRKT